MRKWSTDPCSCRWRSVRVPHFSLSTARDPGEGREGKQAKTGLTEVIIVTVTDLCIQKEITASGKA